MKALLIGGERDGEIVAAPPCSEIHMRGFNGVHINRSLPPIAFPDKVETRTTTYRRFAERTTQSELAIYTCLPFEETEKRLAEAYLGRANVRAVDEWVYKTLRMIDNYAAFAASGDHYPREILEAQIQQVTELLK